MATDLAKIAKERGIKYFLISYVDLFGTLRAKLAPAAAIADMAKDGAGFAGFASWLDMTPADPDVLAIPDPASLIQLPWKREVGWLAADPYMNGKPVEHAPRNILKRMIAKAAKAGFQLKTGVECEFFLLSPDGAAISDAADTQSKPCYDQSALMRRYDVISEICDSMLELGWGAYQNDHEDANGQFEMNWASTTRSSPPIAWPSSNTWSRPSPRSMACAPPSCRSLSPISPAAAATSMPPCGRATRIVSTTARTRSACRAPPTTSSAG